MNREKNKKVVYIVCVVIFAILLILSVTLLKKENEEEISNHTKMVRESDSKVAVLEVNANTFKEEVIESKKPVLVDFYASWCPPCKMLSPIVEEIAKEKNEIKVVKVNVDNATEISNKYAIHSIPTLVLVKDGEEVKRTVGLIEKEIIENMIKESF